MKKIYTSLFVCLLFSIAYSQTIPFPAGRLKTYLTNGSSLTVAKDLNGNNVSRVDLNNDGELQYNEVENISYLSFTANTTVATANLYNVDGLEYFIHLQYLDLNYHELSTLDVSMFPELKTLSVQSNNLTSIVLDGLTHLESFTFFGNPFAVLRLHDLPALTTLNANIGSWFGVGTHQVILENLPALTSVNCSSSLLTSLQLINMPNLVNLDCGWNQIPTLDLTGAPNLTDVQASSNLLTSINLAGVSNLSSLRVSTNNLTNLDFTLVPNLRFFEGEHNLFSALDLSNLSQLLKATMAYNSLQYLFIKNGKQYTSSAFANGYLSLNFNPNLKYICCDEASVAMFQARMVTYGYNNVEVNTYCSFYPGGEYYTVSGNNRYDSTGNGCDASDLPFPNFKLSVATGNLIGTYNIPNATGTFSFPVTAGAYTVNPVIENPAYFTISPASFNVNFPTQASPVTQNFCVAPNGIHNDVDVVIIPVTNARPGFDASYKIVYRNKGTLTASGAISLGFNDAVLDLVSTDTEFVSQAINALNWDFIDLLPFETREILVTFNLNTPSEEPPVFGGFSLQFSGSITSVATDELSADNLFTLNQTVVNSFDPNDKTCLEGTTITPAMVGKEVHYMIRFENTGTANAENIVVKDMIDTTKFDINSLIPMDSCHPFVTKISNTNKVEFIFENINLPFDDANNDGYIVFKIKTKPSLVVGNSFSNTASIYFDYNLPIITNTATTTVALLANQDFDFEQYFRIYPNPAKDVLNIEMKKSFEVNSISIYNTLGQLVLVIPNAQQTKTIDVSSLKTGNYFMKINSNKGSSALKFIKI
ncbi:T9SS type A sorting domain-containing protein [Flavobacterium sp.]|uniref:T9SS type A sorting domain-containing protein n=1 Tax=Flavobacterium sp. TaxID=239 RepID=UPI00261DE1EA|nr:T9SS type A sorting domain-containing protein [Flavobacterium sp.]